MWLVGDGESVVSGLGGEVASGGLVAGSGRAMASVVVVVVWQGLFW